MCQHNFIRFPRFSIYLRSPHGGGRREFFLLLRYRTLQEKLFLRANFHSVPSITPTRTIAGDKYFPHGRRPQDTTLYSCVGKAGVFERVESAAELEVDLHSIVELGNKWLVSFNATKTKLLSFNRHRDPLLVPVKMSGTELPEETSFRLLAWTFKSVYGLEALYIVHC